MWAKLASVGRKSDLRAISRRSSSCFNVVTDMMGEMMMYTWGIGSYTVAQQSSLEQGVVTFLLSFPFFLPFAVLSSTHCPLLLQCALVPIVAQWVNQRGRGGDRKSVV